MHKILIFVALCAFWHQNTLADGDCGGLHTIDADEDLGPPNIPLNTIEADAEEMGSFVSEAKDEGDIYLPSKGKHYYEVHLNCGLYIEAREGTHLVFEVVKFNTESYWDTLKIQDGDGETHRLSGYKSWARVVLSDDNPATLLFTSDSSVTKTGFHIKWYREDNE